MRKFLTLLSFSIAAATSAQATEILETKSPRTTDYKSLGSLSHQIQPNISQEEIEQIAHINFPREFLGVQDIDSAVVNGFRKTQIGHKGKVNKTALTLHEPALYPLASKFKEVLNDFAGKVPHAPTANRFLMEMQYHETMKDVNPAWLYFLHFRFAAAVSPITDSQKVLFSHIPLPSLFFGMIEKDSWKNESSAFWNIEYYDNEGFELPEDHFAYNLPSQFIDQACDFVERNLPAKVLYPIVNKDKLGVSFIVKSNIDDIYPIALPFYEKNPKAKKISAHGIAMSTFPFATHDALHEHVDQRRYNFIQHVVEEIDLEVDYGGDAWKFSNVYIPSAIQRYQMVRCLLKHIYNDMVGALLPNRGLAEYRKAMTGFFWIDHEKPNFPSSIYNMNDVDKILETITSQEAIDTVAASIDRIDSWTSPYDPLKTSPTDGSSGLSDNEIYQFVEDNLTTAQSNAHKYHPVSYSQSLQYGMTTKRIVRGKRFIDVFYQHIDGGKYQFSFPTMYHKWLNADDTLGLLRYGGTVIHKPVLLGQTVAASREIARKTLTQIEQAIDGHVNHFRTVASFFLNRREENSFAKRYFKQHFKQDQLIAKKLGEL